MAKKSRRLNRVLRPAGGPRIACINKAKIPLGVDFDKLIAVLQIYVNKCLVPAWGTPARLFKATKPIRGAWTMIFFDNADEAGDLGYHDIHKNGMPLGKVFVLPTIEGGDKVSVTAAHELAEMLIDPSANLWSDGPRRSLWGYEVCDAVEEDEFDIQGVAMSNFVYPAYFELFRLGKRKTTPYDYMNKVKQPFEIRPGGYSDIRQGRRVKSRFGSAKKARKFAKEDRRYHRSEYRAAIASHDAAVYHKVCRTGLA